MPQKALTFAALFALLLSAFPARQLAQGLTAQNGGNLINDIVIPAIPNAPFSATAVIEFERIWPDGSSQIYRTINLIARDSQGRTHNESRRLMPESFHGSPQLMSVQLFDPLTHIRATYEPARHIAHQQVIPDKPKTADIANPAIHTQDLGTTTLNGLQARGTRRTYTISARLSATGEAVEMMDEDWYSEELHLNLLVRHSAPSIGDETIGISNLKREEPAASMFQIPAGYQTLEVTPNPAPLAGRKPGAVPIP
ncbi:MAG TPA: hypothetical protein VGG56_01390 [Terracidiphilus sp.]